jgi:hypothetical protein
MDAYISKPVIKDALVALVDRIVTSRSLSQDTTDGGFLD